MKGGRRGGGPPRRLRRKPCLWPPHQVTRCLRRNLPHGRVRLGQGWGIPREILGRSTTRPTESGEGVLGTIDLGTLVVASIREPRIVGGPVYGVGCQGHKGWLFWSDPIRSIFSFFFFCLRFRFGFQFCVVAIFAPPGWGPPCPCGSCALAAAVPLRQPTVHCIGGMIPGTPRPRALVLGGVLGMARRCSASVSHPWGEVRAGEASER